MRKGGDKCPPIVFLEGANIHHYAFVEGAIIPPLSNAWRGGGGVQMSTHAIFHRGADVRGGGMSGSPCMYHWQERSKINNETSKIQTDVQTATKLYAIPYFIGRYQSQRTLPHEKYRLSYTCTSCTCSSMVVLKIRRSAVLHIDDQRCFILAISVVSYR